MGIITISIGNETEKKLRRLARVMFRGGKGRLGLAVTEAIEEWADKKKENSISKSVELLDEGIDMGGMVSKRRGDWHGR